MKPSSKSFIVIAICISMLAGCTVGPEYKRPGTAVPPQWPVTLPGTGTGEATEEWWKSFHDTELDSLVAQAAGSNLDLKLATARVEEARAFLGINKSGLLPQVTANDSARRFRQVGVAFLPNGQGRPVVQRFPFEMSLFEPLAAMTWEIDIFGRVRRGVQAASADVRAQVEDRRNVLVMVLGDVGANYLQTRGFQLRLDLAQKNIGIQQDILDLTRALSRGGQSTERDVAQAEAELESTKAVVPVLATGLDAAIRRLGVLLGRDPESLRSELTTAAPLPPASPGVPAGLPSDLLKRRPDIRRAEAQLQAASARIGQAKADYFPVFSLTGSAGRAAPQLSGLTAGLNNIFDIGPSVSLPIFTGGRIRANVAVQTARFKQASVTYEIAVLIALEETENALTSYSNDRERVERLQKVVDANRTAFDLSQIQYKAGLADFLTVLDAERTLFNNQDLLAQSQIALVVDLVTLYRALGGGWSGFAAVN